MRHRNGFSLIELLLVLAILGIISAIAIPSFMGQRQRARLIGDAKTNVQALSMQMESLRLESGTYPVSSTAIVFSKSQPTNAKIPGFNLSGESMMKITLTSTGTTFNISTEDTTKNKKVYEVDQTGKVLYELK